MSELFTVRDERFYNIDGVYYPRCTFILSVYPKGAGYEQWLKAQGDDADSIRDRAADAGTRVHDACEQLVAGVALHHLAYQPGEWSKINSFVTWYTQFKPDRYVGSEVTVWSKTHGYAGTADAIIEKDGKRYLIDYKTGKGLYPTYWLQLAAYKQAYEELGYGRIDGVGILHLGSRHKSVSVKKSKKGQVVYTGPGYEYIVETAPDVMDLSFARFKSTKDIFDNEYPALKPVELSYPTQLQILKDNLIT